DWASNSTATSSPIMLKRTSVWVHTRMTRTRSGRDGRRPSRIIGGLIRMKRGDLTICHCRKPWECYGSEIICNINCAGDDDADRTDRTVGEGANTGQRLPGRSLLSVQQSQS